MQFTFFVQLALILVCTQVFGFAAEKFGQCKVIGQVIAGLVLGPSLFGHFSPDAYSYIFNPEASRSMSLFSEMGLVLLMFQIGLELDLSHLKERVNRHASIVVALTGIALPFLFGVVIAAYSINYLPLMAHPLGYILFCGIALSITAVPVMKQMISDMGIGKLAVCTVALSAAVLTDVIGWIFLAVIVQISSSNFEWSALMLRLGLIMIYCLGCIFVVRPFLRALVLRMVEKKALDSLPLNSVIFVCILLSAWLTTMLGLHSAFGALMIGFLLRDQKQFIEHWAKTVGGFVLLVLLPVFFAYAGTHAKIGALESITLLPWFLLFLAGAILGKFGGCYLGARACGIEWRHARIVGVLMNTRGMMELIVLTIGLDLQILPPEVYTMLMLMALATTFITIPMLRRWIPSLR